MRRAAISIPSNIAEGRQESGPFPQPFIDRHGFRCGTRDSALLGSYLYAQTQKSAEELMRLDELNRMMRHRAETGRMRLPFRPLTPYLARPYILALCGQLEVLMHESAGEDWPTGCPFTKCDSTISLHVLQLHESVPDRFGVDHHGDAVPRWSRHPAALTRTRLPSWRRPS